MTNGSQKYVDTHNNNKTNKDKQADSHQQNAEHIHVAAADCQHSGHSLPAATHLRNITNRGYGEPEGTP
jgi:hypothetical protein